MASQGRATIGLQPTVAALQGHIAAQQAGFRQVVGQIQQHRDQCYKNYTNAVQENEALQQKVHNAVKVQNYPTDIPL